jgi:heat shock protein HslJ
MNKKLITYAVAALVASYLPMAGCSALSSMSSNSSSEKTKKQTATEVVSEAHTTSAAAATHKTDETLAGEWVITAVGSKTISQDEDMPYVTFVPSEGKFYGSNGCNVINGSYSVSGATMKFSDVLATMKYCPEVEYDGQITALMQDGKSATYTLKNSGNETIMTLVGTENGITLTLCRHNMQYLNGQWQVTDINGKGVDDEEANIFFDVDELKIHGNTGCNYFNGSILIDPSKANAINFSGMAVTRMSCPKLDQERLMLVALEETETIVKHSDGTVTLRNGAGKTVLKLKKVEVKSE